MTAVLATLAVEYILAGTAMGAYVARDVRHGGAPVGTPRWRKVGHVAINAALWWLPVARALTEL